MVDGSGIPAQKGLAAPGETDFNGSTYDNECSHQIESSCSYDSSSKCRHSSFSHHLALSRSSAEPLLPKHPESGQSLASTSAPRQHTTGTPLSRRPSTSIQRDRIECSMHDDGAERLKVKAPIEAETKSQVPLEMSAVEYKGKEDLNKVIAPVLDEKSDKVKKKKKKERGKALASSGSDTPLLTETHGTQVEHSSDDLRGSASMVKEETTSAREGRGLALTSMVVQLVADCSNTSKGRMQSVKEAIDAVKSQLEKYQRGGKASSTVHWASLVEIEGMLNVLVMRAKELLAPDFKDETDNSSNRTRSSPSRSDTVTPATSCVGVEEESNEYKTAKEDPSPSSSETKYYDAEQVEKDRIVPVPVDTSVEIEEKEGDRAAGSSTDIPPTRKHTELIHSHPSSVASSSVSSKGKEVMRLSPSSSESFIADLDDLLGQTLRLNSNSIEMDMKELKGVASNGEPVWLYANPPSEEVNSKDGYEYDFGHLNLTLDFPGLSLLGAKVVLCRMPTKDFHMQDERDKEILKRCMERNGKEKLCWASTLKTFVQLAQLAVRQDKELTKDEIAFKNDWAVRLSDYLLSQSSIEVEEAYQNLSMDKSEAINEHAWYGFKTCWSELCSTHIAAGYDAKISTSLMDHCSAAVTRGILNYILCRYSSKGKVVHMNLDVIAHIELILGLNSKPNANSLKKADGSKLFLALTRAVNEIPKEWSTTVHRTSLAIRRELLITLKEKGEGSKEEMNGGIVADINSIQDQGLIELQIKCWKTLHASVRQGPLSKDGFRALMVLFKQQNNYASLQVRQILRLTGRATTLESWNIFDIRLHLREFDLLRQYWKKSQSGEKYPLKIEKAILLTLQEFSKVFFQHMRRVDELVVMASEAQAKKEQQKSTSITLSKGMTLRFDRRSSLRLLGYIEAKSIELGKVNGLSDLQVKSLQMCVNLALALLWVGKHDEELE